MNKMPEYISFSNISTKLKFEYQVNTFKTGETSSLTFFYKMCLPLKISVNEGVNDVFDIFQRFEETITGRVYGGLIIEKYKQEDTFCYLIHDNTKYKIGKSTNPKQRLKQIRTGNPNARLICQSKNVPEKLLHDAFADKNVGLEWFDLDDRDVDMILALMRIDDYNILKIIARMFKRQVGKAKKVTTKVNKYVESVRKKPNPITLVKMNFGKYKGKVIYQMSSNEELAYLHWAINNATVLSPSAREAVKRHLKIK